MTRIEQVQTDIKPFTEKVPIGFSEATKLLEYWEKRIVPNTGYYKSEDGSYYESIDRAEAFWGSKDLIRSSKLDAGLFPEEFYNLFAKLEMMVRVVEWKAHRNAQFLFDRHKYERFLLHSQPKENKIYFIDKKIKEIEKAFEPFELNEKTSYAGGKYVKQLLLFHYEKPYLLKKKEEILLSENEPLEQTLIRDISANNDWNFYYNTQNIRNQSFVLETEQYFETGARKGFLEPLVFMNLFWEQLQYFIKNAHKPYSTLQHFEALRLTAEQRHVLYCFILKFYGGYPLPVSNIDGIQLETTLLLISEAFLRYRGDTTEKEYCRNINQPKNLNDKLISLEPLPESYQYTANDFEGVAANNDWDFYHNLENTKEQQHLVFPIKKYFQSGQRTGFIEPLAFMNLFWEQREKFFQSQNSVRSFTDNLKRLPINEEVRHVLYGWFLKFVGGYHYQPKGLWYDPIFIKIENAFESYEGKTPEKWFCLREDEQDKEKSEGKAIQDAEIDKEKIELIEVREYSYEDCLEKGEIGSAKEGRYLAYDEIERKYFYKVINENEYAKIYDKRKENYLKEVVTETQKLIEIFNERFKKSEDKERLLKVEIEEYEQLLFVEKLPIPIYISGVYPIHGTTRGTGFYWPYLESSIELDFSNLIVKPLGEQTKPDEKDKSILPYVVHKLDCNQIRDIRELYSKIIVNNEKDYLAEKTRIRVEAIARFYKYLKEFKTLPPQQTETKTEQESERNFTRSTIEDWLFEFKEQMSETDYSTLVSALIIYFDSGKFPTLKKAIQINGRPNKKLFGWALNRIFEAKSKGVEKELLIFAKQNISLFAEVQFDINNIQKSNLYKYFTTKTK